MMYPIIIGVEEAVAAALGLCGVAFDGTMVGTACVVGCGVALLGAVVRNAMILCIMWAAKRKAVNSATRGFPQRLEFDDVVDRRDGGMVETMKGYHEEQKNMPPYDADIDEAVRRRLVNWGF